MPSNTTYGLHIPVGTDAANTAIKDPTNPNALDAAAGHVWEVSARTSSEQTVLTCNVVSATATGGQFAANGPAMAIYLNTNGVINVVATPTGTAGGTILWGSPIFFVSPTNTTTSPSAVISAAVVSASTYLGLPQLSIVPTPQVLAPGSGTYVTPAGARTLWIRCVGGGGGGGAGGNSGSNLSSSGGAGGAGGYVEGWITTPAATYVYTVGTGGAAGTNSPLVNGTAGNPSSFGVNISAGGGSGGISIGNGNAGGAGGVVTLTGITGISTVGNPGGAGSVAISVGGSNDQIAGPSGGSSIFGGAGVGGDAGNGNGRAAFANSGSGGGGGTGISNGSSGGIGIGGAGASGTIIVVAF